jgi:hypothetical protein
MQGMTGQGRRSATGATVTVALQRRAPCSLPYRPAVAEVRTFTFRRMMRTGDRPTTSAQSKDGQRFPFLRARLGSLPFVSKW